jgi:hypothetical protein
MKLKLFLLRKSIPSLQADRSSVSPCFCLPTTECEIGIHCLFHYPASMYISNRRSISFILILGQRIHVDCLNFKYFPGRHANVPRTTYELSEEKPGVGGARSDGTIHSGDCNLGNSPTGFLSRRGCCINIDNPCPLFRSHRSLSPYLLVSFSLF